MTDKQHIQIALVSGDGVNPSTMASVHINFMHLLQSGYPVSSNHGTSTFVDHNHNVLIERFLEGINGAKADVLVFVDSDMQFRHDAIEKLVLHDVDVAGVVYRRRAKPHDLMGWRADGRAFETTDTGLVPATRLGAGLIAIKRRVYEGMAYPWYENVYGRNSKEFDGGDTWFCAKADQQGFGVFADCDVSRSVSHVGVLRLVWDPEQAYLGTE